jgi:hypothetical protein
MKAKPTPDASLVLHRASSDCLVLNTSAILWTKSLATRILPLNQFVKQPAPILSFVGTIVVTLDNSSSSGSHVGNTHTAPGHLQFHAYSAECFAKKENETILLIYDSQVAQHGNQEDNSDDDLPVNNDKPMEWDATNTTHEINLNGPSPHALPPSNMNNKKEQQLTIAVAKLL